MWSKDRKPIGIFTADLHLKHETPICRIDNYEETIKEKFIFLLTACQNYDVPLFIAGDFFDIAGASTRLINWCMDIIYKYDVTIYACPGQHDLPYNSMKFYKWSAFYTLVNTGYLNWNKHIEEVEGNLNVVCTPYGWAPDTKKTVDAMNKKNINICLWHKMVIDQKLFPGQEAMPYSEVLDKFNYYDLIVLGDNHAPFVIKDEKTKTIIVNCGSVGRTTIKQKDYRPSAWVVYTNGDLYKLNIPIKKDVFDLTLKIKKNDELDVSTLQTKLSVSTDFEKEVRKEIKSKPELKKEFDSFIYYNQKL